MSREALNSNKIVKQAICTGFKIHRISILILVKVNHIAYILTR